MGLFSRRKRTVTDRTTTEPQAEADSAYPQVSRADADWIRATGQRILRDLGREVHVSEDQAVLVASSGETFGLDNAVAKCVAAERDQWPHVLEQHFGSVVRALSGPTITDLTPDQLAAQVRTRLVPTSSLARGEADLSYGRPFTEDLSVVLCVDFPETVGYIDSTHAARLDLDVLFQQGQQNTDAEPVDEAFEVQDTGVTVLQGESLFIASKVVNMDALVQQVFGRPAPHGVVFAVPDRNTALLHPIESGQAVAAIGELTRIGADHFPTGVGPLTPNSYHWHQGAVTKIGMPNTEKNTIEIMPTPALMEIIEQVAAQDS